MHKTHYIQEDLGLNVSSHALSFSTSLLLVLVPLKCHCMSYQQDFHEKGMKGNNTTESLI